MLLNIRPEKVFQFFYEINQIPRCSDNEKQISDYLYNFAKKRNLEVEQDEALNIIIRKKASKGYEDSTPVIIQGHMDMVCVKEEGSNHDFSKDPIEMIVEGDFVRANGTTLGADDGIAVAYALAILDGDYKHPALEVLLTTAEETGMDGAEAIKEGMLKGKRLLNIDSEEEGEFLVSCSGGCNFHTSFDINREDFIAEGLKIKITGLEGGHSGQEIKKQRANSNILMFRILNEIRKVSEIRIVDIQGGSKHNAIPNDSTCLISVKDIEKAEKIIDKMSKILKSEYRVQEKNMEIITEKSQIDKPFDKDSSDRVIDFFMSIPDGVISMSKEIDGLVKTSLNNAVIEIKNNKLTLETSIRSSSESELDMMLNKLEIIAKNLGADFEKKSRYPAWQFEEDSTLRDICTKTYEELFNKKAKLSAIHAGLECGLLKKVLPDCLMISFGPDMYDIHSPKERLSISSTQNMWEFTLKLLENLK